MTDDDEIDLVVDNIQNRCATARRIEHIGINGSYVYLKFSSKEAAAQGFHFLNHWKYHGNSSFTHPSKPNPSFLQVEKSLLNTFVSNVITNIFLKLAIVVQAITRSIPTYFVCVCVICKQPGCRDLFFVSFVFHRIAEGGY